MKTTIAALTFMFAVAVAQNPPSRIVGKTIWQGQVVEYELVNGRVVIDGDLSLGTLEEVAAYNARSPHRTAGLVHPDSDITTSFPSAVWPTGVVPYDVDPAIPNQQRVTDAVAQWNTKTPLHFIPRTNETTYLHFARDTSTAGACSTARNLSGGQQLIHVLDSCPAGMLAHEIGHAVGLNHEHQRSDRDYYVQIFQQYLEKIRLSDLNLEVGGGTNVGPYDYGSLMHYGRYYTLKTRNSTMESVPAGLVMGLITNLSDGDIDEINRVYGAAPTATTISTNPPGLQVIVDGSVITAPQSFNWAVGSTHTVDVPTGPQSLSGDTTTRYIYGRWSDNQPQAHTITASTITVLELNFVQQFKLQVGASPTTGGLVAIEPPSPDGFYTNNTTVTLTATPSAGLHFLVWGPTGILGQYHGYSNNPVTFPVKSPLTYTATFTSDQAFTLASNPPEVQVGFDANTPIAPRAFDLTPGGTHTVSAQAFVYNQWSTIRQAFVNWSDGGAATHTITIPSTLPATLTANFKTQYMLTTQISGQGTIAVSPTSADGFYDAGTVVTITAKPSTGFQLLNWSGDLSGNALSQTLTMSDEMVVTATFEKPLTIQTTGILSAASYQFTPLAPGECIAIFGLGIGPTGITTAQLDSSGNLSKSVAGTRVLFDGNPSPIVFTSPNVISVIVPYAVAGHATTTIQVELNGQLSNSVSMPVGLSAPGIFSATSNGLGNGAILNQDLSYNSASNPAAKGSLVVLFATGEGQTNPAGVDGKPAVPPYPAPVQPLSVLLGGPAGIVLQGSSIVYAAGAPSETSGLLQVVVQLPANAPSGNVPIAIVVGAQKSPDWLSVSIR